MVAKAGGKLNAELGKALAEELKEVRKKHPKDHEHAGEFIHNALERMRVLDRCLKYESIALKADNPEWGSEFDKEKE